MSEKKIPAIRFKGFMDDWVQHKLRDVFVSLQNNTLSRAELNDSHGAALDIHYGDVLIKFPECLNVKYEQIPFIQETSTADKYKSSLLQNGDIILADTAEDDTVGRCTEITGITKEKVLSGLHTIPYRPQINFATGFLGFYMNSVAYRKQLLPLMQGIKVTSLSKNSMQGTDIKFPKDLHEQADIGQSFLRLDNLIAIHQRKLTKLKLLKKSMLTKMFPKDGARVPEIRFLGFQGDWKQRKLRNITSKIGSGKTPSGGAETYVRTGTPLIRSQNIHDDMVDLSDVVFIDDETNKSMETSVVATNDVLLNITGASIGRSAVYKENEPANVNQHVCIIRLVTGYYSNFVQLHISSSNGQNQIDSSQAGGAREGLNFQQIGKFEFFFPSYKEQVKVGEYFIELNSLITLQQRKLSKLQQIKQAMLSKLFV